VAGTPIETSAHETLSVPEETIDGLQSTSGAGDQRQASPSFDLRTLSAQSPEEARAHRAASMVQCIGRGGSRARRTRGGTSKALVDVGQLLRSYYRSVDWAHRVRARHPEAEASVSAFLDIVSVPPGCEDALLDATAIAPLEPEPPEELGEGRLGGWYGSLAQHIEAYPALQLDFSDPTLTGVVFHNQGWPMDASMFAERYVGPRSLPGRERNGACFVDQLRLYARGLEIHIPGLRISEWGPILARLPRTPSAVRVLLRLMAAVGQDPAAIQIDGMPVNEYRPPAHAPPPHQPAFGPLNRENTFTDIPPDYGVVDDWSKAFTSGVLAAVTLDDETIRDMWERQRMPWRIHERILDLTNLFPMAGRSPEFVVGLLNLAARTRELGVPTAFPLGLERGGTLGALLLGLRDDESATDALHRVAVMFGWDPRRIPFQGRPLAEIPPPSGLGPSNDPLGPELGPDVDPAVGLAALHAGADPTRLAMSDASLRPFLNAFLRSIDEAGLALGQALFREPHARVRVLAVLRLLDRAVRIGATGGLDALRDYLRKDLLHQAESWLDDPEILEVLIALAGRTGCSLDEWMDEMRLVRHPAIVEAVERWRARSLTGLAPLEPRERLQLPETLIPPPPPEEEWGSWSVYRRFESACLAPDRFGRTPESPKRGALEFLKAPISPRFLDTESMIDLLALARAAEFPAAKLRYEVAPDGRWTWLTDHPAFPGRAALEVRRAAAAERLADDVAKLKEGPAGSDPPSSLYQRLLAGDPPIELGALLAALVEARSQGTIAPAPVRASAYAGIGHIGVIAVLAGVAARLTEPEVVELLREKGYSARQASEWGAISHALSELGPEALLFACSDLTRSPPDFTTLRARIALRTFDTVQLIAEKDRDRIAFADPRGFSRAVLEHARSAEPGSDTQKAWLDVIDSTIARGALDARAVRACVDSFEPFELDRKWPLYALLVSPLDSAIASRDAEGADEALERLASYVGMNRAASYALHRQYEEDVLSVLPLRSAPKTLDASAVALHRVRQLADKRTQEAAPDLRLEWAWVDDSLRKALADGLVPDEEMLLGMGEAYHARLIGRATLEAAREAIPSEMAKRVAKLTRSSTARTILLERAVPREMKRVRFAASSEQVTAPRVSRGAVAPRKPTPLSD
jgi:hypothetical protein